MTNNQEELFEELEKLNAQIDTQIDDEEYDNIWGDTKGIITLSNNAKSKVRKCFPDDNGHCTHDKDKEWQKALDYDKDALPVVEVGGKDLQEHIENPIVQAWSHLFYAKLLRAKIKQKGSDCYTRRLDDVVAYLERHLPQQSGQDEWGTRLRLMYLLELSAVSLDWESLGFSERAQRVITDAKHSPRVKKAPYEFYDLWAHYNIGVAYFHKGYYRKAVLEFNRIIWQVVNQWKGRSHSRKFFKEHSGIELLYLPAVIYRADVQLKLQFAYHTLDTLYRYFWNKQESSEHQKIRVMLIEAQAYQQMGRLDKSWGILAGNKNYKVKEKQEGICRLVTGNVQLKQRKDCVILKRDKLNQRFPSLGERFIDILIADHLGWLTLEGKDEEQPTLRIGRLVKGDKNAIQKGEDTVNAYINAVHEAFDKVNGKDKPYPKKLEDIFSVYFDLVEHHAYNRRGYFQQLAEYLAWLAKVADFKYSDPNFARRQDVNNARKKITLIAKKLYNTAKEDGLLFGEDELDKLQNGCCHCQARGIDLRRIESEHYKWFTDDMLEFFNSKSIKSEEIDKDKRKFVGRLIKLERKERDDLRIRDLELRYEYYGMEELLEELRNIENNRQQPREYAEQLCWGELENQAESLNLLECNRRTITKRNKQDPFGDSPMADVYINIIKNWDDSFLRHLKSPSTHEVPASGFYFLGLQRWNSASPAKGYSVGGGYLLYHLDSKNRCVDMGIAIDPGFDFVRNLFHMGFSLDDIDIVLISHAHLDHIRDFESIVMLLSELQKRGKREKRVHVILSLGAYKRLEHIIEDPGYRYFVEPYIIDVDREIRTYYFEDGMPEFRFEPVNTNGERASSNSMERIKAVLPGKEFSKGLRFRVMITPTRAYHDDKTYSDSFGFVVELAEKVKGTGGQDKHEVKLAFGYTGDTKWVYPGMPDPVNKKDNGENKLKERKIEDIAGQYLNCDVLLIHLGSLIKKNDDDEWSFNQYDQCGINAGNKYRCEELVRKENHPYLVGMLRLLSSLYKNLPKVNPMPLVLVGEFGEELRGRIRSDFIQRLQGIYKNRLAFLPVDVGMNVYLRRKGSEQDRSRGNRCACRVWCVQCNHFVNIGDADFELYGADHALYCVCKTCKKAMPLDVLQDRLRQLYEVGLELRPYEGK